MNYDLADSGASFTTQVKQMVVYGDPGGGSTPLAPSLTTANVNVNVTKVGISPVYVTVTIQNYTITNLFRNFALTNKPRVTVAYTGNIICSGC